MRRRTRTLLTAAALAASLPLPAQPNSTAPSAEAAPYRSAFEGYRAFESGEIQDWRKSNNTVREIGGWRAYAREIQGGTQSPASPGSAPAPAQATPHQGHQR